MSNFDITKINLRNDIIFKYVFAADDSQDILIDLLNAVFIDSGEELITEITYLNPLNLKEHIDDKSTVLDIKAVDGKGRHYNIEMQVRQEPNFRERMIYYNAKLLTSQLKEGMSYPDLRKTISIAITDYILLQEEKPIHNIYKTLNVKSHRELADIVEYHFIELPKYKDDKKNELIINKWLYTIKNGENYINNPEGLPDTIKKEAMIMKAINKMAKAAADDEVRAVIEYREKAKLDELNRFRHAIDQTRESALNEGLVLGKQEGLALGKQEGLTLGKQEGLALGKQEGLTLGKQEGLELGKQEGLALGEKRALEMVAMKMLANKISIDEIAKNTGLPKSDILKLKQ